MELLIRGRTLRQVCTYHGVGSVHLEDELEFWVWLGKDWSRREAVLEFPERCLCLKGPVEWSEGGGESGERSCQMTVVMDEASKTWQTPGNAVTASESPAQATDCPNLGRVHS